MSIENLFTCSFFQPSFRFGQYPAKIAIFTLKKGFFQYNKAS
ncbi:hypothetical protein QSI_4661 [Clostridioides difficile P28]|nr:hypothetical protein QSI_4661 [Clostridioides difficile P28]